MVDEGDVQGFRGRTIRIGGEHYATEVMGGAGIEKSSIQDPEQFALNYFNEQMKNAIRRVRYALRNRK